jgi:hypothetical protein
MKTQGGNSKESSRLSESTGKMNIFSPKEENKSQFDNFVQDF